MTDPSGLYWMSFVDPDRPAGQRFLGVTIVWALDPVHAVTEAWAQGTNPGGEVGTIGPFPAGTWPADKLNRLLPEQEARALAETEPAVGADTDE